MSHIRFNWVDILFVTLLIRICYIGFKSSFLPEFLRALGLLAAFIFSFNGYTSLSSFLSIHTKWTGPKPDTISFLFIFVLILFAFKMLALAARIFFGGKENVSRASKLTGFALGIGRAFLLVNLLYILFANGPFAYLSKSAEERSFLGKYVAGVTPFVYKISMKFYPWEKIDTPLVRLIKP